MKISFDLMIRGDGAAYYQISIAGCSKPDKLAIEAHTSNGNPFPATLIPLTHTDKQDTFVIATPLFDAPSIDLSLSYHDHNDSRSIWKKTVAKDQLKWNSRFAYKARKKQAVAIRDIDRIQRKDSINFTTVFFHLSHFTNHTDEYILKALLSTPTSVQDLTISIIDGQGNPVELKPHYGEIRTSNNGVEERNLRAFTLRLPCDDKTYILFCTDRASGQTGFLCLDPISKIRIEERQNPHDYKLAWISNYEKWFMQQSSLSAEEPFSSATTFSIVVPLYKTPTQFLKEMIESVQNQTYQNWELILVNASPEDETLRDNLALYTDPRIVIINLNENKGIADNTNVGIKAAHGDYVALLDHDDILACNALAEYERVISAHDDIAVIYCDEDLLLPDNVHAFPHFKSDFNIDLLRCHNYVTHFLAVKRQLIQDLLLRSEYDGAQDYDLILRLSEQVDTFYHVPQVLYHWRTHEQSTAASADNKPYADIAGCKALQAHLDRIGLKGTACRTDLPCLYKVDYEVIDQPLVSIIIPNKDNIDTLDRCLNSLLHNTSYSNIEIIIVENNSTEDKTFAYYKTLDSDPRIKVVTWSDSFNYSAVNNYGAQFAHGDYLLLLNNDVESINPDWLTSMLSLCQREEVGIVGAKLLYPDNTVQHAGVAMLKCFESYEIGGAIHIFANIDKDDPAYQARAILRQDLSAVTAACLLTKKKLYDELGGLDETFVVAYNDIDFCLRVREAGYLVVFDPEAKLYHYESLTRGPDDSKTSPEKFARFIKEQSLLRARWSMYYAKGDPYHPPFFGMSVN